MAPPEKETSRRVGTLARSQAAGPRPRGGDPSEHPVEPHGGDAPPQVHTSEDEQSGTSKAGRAKRRAGLLRVVGSTRPEEQANPRGDETGAAKITRPPFGGRVSDIRTQKSDPVDSGSGRSRDQAFFAIRRRRAAAPTRPAPARSAGAGTGT